MTTWILEDLTEQIDIQENDSQITKVRQHFTIQIRTLILCSAIPSRGDIGKRQASIPYTVGSLNAKKDAPTSCMFICVSDGFTPVEHPGDYCIRRQTWESFGKFIDAPASWNQ